MSKIRSLFKYLIEYPDAADKIFFIAITSYFIGAILDTTMIVMPEGLDTSFMRLGVNICLFKILVYDIRSRQQAIKILSVLALFKVIGNNADSSMLLHLAIFIIGAKGVSFEKVIRIYAVVCSTIMVIAFAGTWFGYAEDLVYRSGVYARHSFGIIYPTDFAAHIFFLITSYLYLSRKYVWVILLAISACGFSAVVFQYCHTRLDCFCIVLVAILFIFIKLLESHLSSGHYYWMKILLSRMGMIMPALCAVTMLVLAYIYTPDVQILDKLDGWLSHRLKLGREGFTEYPLVLWGQYIDMNGFGGGLTHSFKKYFFIDCSYQLIMMKYGIVSLVLLILLNAHVCHKLRGNPYFSVTVIVIAINCMVAHHMIDLAYNPFMLALLTEYEDTV